MVSENKVIVSKVVPGRPLVIPHGVISAKPDPRIRRVKVHDPATSKEYELKYEVVSRDIVLQSLPAGLASPRVVVELEDGSEVTFRSREVILSGATNFRDSGGYHIKAGILPWDRVFRSDNLAKVSFADWQNIHSLGIRRIVDLRVAEERIQSPTKLPESFGDIELISIPMSGEIAGTMDAISVILNGGLESISASDMGEMYRIMLRSHFDDFLSVLSLLEEDSSSATLVHCTAGKDRTGLVVAFYQLRSGVRIEDVLSDYVRSNILRTPFRVEFLTPVFNEAGIDITRFIPNLSAPPKAFFEALAFARKQYPTLVYPRPVGR